MYISLTIITIQLVQKKDEKATFKARKTDIGSQDLPGCRVIAVLIVAFCFAMPAHSWLKLHEFNTIKL